MNNQSKKFNIYYLIGISGLILNSSAQFNLELGRRPLFYFHF